MLEISLVFRKYIDSWKFVYCFIMLTYAAALFFDVNQFSDFYCTKHC